MGEKEADRQPSLAIPPPAGGASESRRQQADSLWLPSPLRSLYFEGASSASLARYELARGVTDQPRVALTFDAHLDARPLAAILRVLSRFNIRATFFLTGHWAEQYPHLVRRLADAGHELGNHTYSHPHLTRLDDQEVLSECERAQTIIEHLAGRSFPPYLRPPYGDRDLRVYRLLVANGFIPVYWTVDSLDWKQEATPAAIVHRVLGKGALPGAILLHHVGSAHTAEALPQIIEGLLERGLQPGRLTDVLTR